MFLAANKEAVASSEIPYFPNIKGKVITSVELDPSIKTPGIILIIIDTIRPDHLSAYGYPKPTSPFIDSIAAKGVLFANHFSNSTWTKPSVASIFTGLFPRKHNVLHVGDKLSSSIPTMAQVFKQAGFKTAAIMGNSFAGTKYGFDKGFDRFAEPSTHFNGKNPTAAQALNLATKWLQEDKNSPFFYTIFLFDPHDPYTPLQSYKERFCDHCKEPEITVPQREYHGRGPSQSQINDMKGLFDGEIRYTDDRLKIFYDSIKNMGISDRLTTVIAGDHGEAFGEHHVFEHAFHMWDEVVRTPLIISSPRISSKGIYKSNTQHADLFPTLVKIAGITNTAKNIYLQGVPLVKEQQEPTLTNMHNKMILTEVQMYGIHRIAVRSQQYKYVVHKPLNEAEFRNYYPDPRIYPSVSINKEKRELYDLNNDPKEHTNITNNHKPLSQSLEKLVNRYLLTGSFEEELSSAKAPSQDLLEDLKSLGYIQ